MSPKHRPSPRPPRLQLQRVHRRPQAQLRMHRQRPATMQQQQLQQQPDRRALHHRQTVQQEPRKRQVTSISSRTQLGRPQLSTPSKHCTLLRSSHSLPVCSQLQVSLAYKTHSLAFAPLFDFSLFLISSTIPDVSGVFF